MLKQSREKTRNENWNQRIWLNYFKALDVLSNILRIQQKSLLSNKTVLQSLKNLKGSQLTQAWPGEDKAIDYVLND